MVEEPGITAGQGPKVLLTDTGLVAELIGVDAARYAAIDQGDIAGMLFETLVVMELVKQRTWARNQVQIRLSQNPSAAVGIADFRRSGLVVGGPAFCLARGLERERL